MKNVLRAGVIKCEWLRKFAFTEDLNNHINYINKVNLDRCKMSVDRLNITAKKHAFCNKTANTFYFQFYHNFPQRFLRFGKNNVHSRKILPELI